MLVLLRRIEEFAGFGDVFVGDLIDKEKDSLWGFVGYFADNLGDPL